MAEVERVSSRSWLRCPSVERFTFEKGSNLMNEITINEESLCFYFELGLALTQFKSVSDCLYKVLEASIAKDGEESTKMLRRYADARNFGAQLEITTKMLPELLREEFHSDWGELSKALIDAKDKRNTLAHCWLMTDDNNRPGERCMLLPTSGKEWRGAEQINDRAIYLLDIVRIRHTFFSLSNRLTNSDWRLRGEPENYPNGQLAEPDKPILSQIMMGPYRYLGVERPAK